MGVEYYYNPDSAAIAIVGKRDCALIGEAITALEGEGVSHLSDEVLRITQGSEWKGSAPTEAVKYVFDDSSERTLILRGLRFVSEQIPGSGLRSRYQKQRIKRLAGKIGTAEW